MLLLIVAFITLADDAVLVLGPALWRGDVFNASVNWSGFFSCALGCGAYSAHCCPDNRRRHGGRQ